MICSPLIRVTVVIKDNPSVITVWGWRVTSLFAWPCKLENVMIALSDWYVENRRSP
jgi:hypothetical protein